MNAVTLDLRLFAMQVIQVHCLQHTLYTYIQYCMSFVHIIQDLQILLMSGVSVTSASQILESFWNIWSQVS